MSFIDKLDDIDFIKLNECDLYIPTPYLLLEKTWLLL